MSRHVRPVLLGVAIAIGVVIAALVVASFALDAYVRRHERDVVAQLETRLGRKVEIRRLSASLWTGLSADGVTIAGARTPGDEAPLLTVERVRVRPALLSTLVTLGRRVDIASIRVEKPIVNVVRLRDGSLNVDHVAEHWQKTAPAEPAKPMSARTRRLVEHARLRHARVDDGRVRFTDRLAGGRTVEIGAIVLTLADVGLQRHPSMTLHAAVLAQKPNLELQAQLGRAGSLEKLPPPLESARVQLGRTDLAPLMPLVARAVPGLQAGIASADLTLRWNGAAEAKGNARLERARFAGGAPFDATLDVDLGGDLGKRDLDVRKLVVAVGPMSLVAHGRVASLAKTPRFENVELATRALDFDELRRIYPALDRRLGATLHGPVELHASGSSQQLAAVVDLTAASIAAPGRFDKPRGTPWRLDARGHAHENVIDVDALTLTVARQTLRGHGSVRVGQAHPTLDARVTTDGLALAALAPLVPSLAGLPPIVVSADARLDGRVGLPATMALEVARFAVTSRQSDVAGALALRDFSRPQLELTARSRYLDTADLLPSKPSKPAAPARAPSPPRAGGPSPALQHLGGHARVDVARGVASGIAFDGLHADVAMRDGALHANDLSIGAWNGRVVASGSDFDLARETFHLVGHVADVAVEPLLQRFGGASKVLRGRLTADLDVRGRGSSPADLERTLTGTLAGAVDGAELLAFDLDALLSSQLVRALPLPLPTRRLANATKLGTLRGQIRFADGAILVEQPLTATTAAGALSLSGRFYFDGRLDLTGTLALAPDAASALFADRVRLTEPLPLWLRFGGDIHHPTLGIANIADVARVLVRALVGGAIPGQKEAKVPSRDELEKEAADRLKGLFGH